jgi:hypothetical protein
MIPNPFPVFPISVYFSLLVPKAVNASVVNEIVAAYPNVPALGA